MAAVFLGGKALASSITFTSEQPLPLFGDADAVLAPTGDLVSTELQGAAESRGATHLSLHTSSPGTDGANEISGSRTAVTLAYSSGALRVVGDTTGATELTGATATHLGVWKVT